MLQYGLFSHPIIPSLTIGGRKQKASVLLPSATAVDVTLALLPKEELTGMLGYFWLATWENKVIFPWDVLLPEVPVAQNSESARCPKVGVIGNNAGESQVF